MCNCISNYEGGELSRTKKALEQPHRTKDSKDNRMNILPGNMRFGAGQAVKRLEDQRLLTGKGQFIDDRPEDGALWLHVLRSPMPTPGSFRSTPRPRPKCPASKRSIPAPI